VHGATAGAQNPNVIALFRKWAYQHENQRAFIRQDEILDYLRKLKVFIEHAEKVVAAIRAQRSDSSKDSISAAEELIQHAREKGKFFESR